MCVELTLEVNFINKLCFRFSCIELLFLLPREFKYAIDHFVKSWSQQKVPNKYNVAYNVDEIDTCLKH